MGMMLWVRIQKKDKQKQKAALEAQLSKKVAQGVQAPQLARRLPNT